MGERGARRLCYLTWYLWVNKLSATIAFFFPICFCLYLHLIKSFSYEYWETNDEHWAPNKPEIFGLVGENSVTNMKCFSMCMKITPCCAWVFFYWHTRFKEGHKEVKDDSRSRRLLTNRTEVNIEWITHVVCGDHWLTVWMIVSQLDMKKDSVWIITGDLSMSGK